MDNLTTKFDSFTMEIRSDFQHFQTHLDKLDNRVDNHDKILEDHNKKFGELFEAQKAHDERVAASLENAQQANRAFAASAPPGGAPASSGTNFDRPPRKNIISSNVHGNAKFQKSEFEKILKSILSEKGLDGAPFEIPGPAESKRFAATFTGPSADEVVLSVLRARKRPDGEWREFCIKIEGADVKLYLGPDKSTKAIRLETITKKFAAHLGSVYGNRSFFPRKQEGEISMDGQRLAFIDVTPVSASLKWNTPVLEGSGIAKEDMVAYFNNTFNVQWSS